MTDLSWLWLNDELSDVKIRLVCMGAHAQPPAAQQIKQAAGQVQACDGHSYATRCAHGQLPGSSAMRDPMHDAMPTAVGGKALEGEQEKETCVELPAHAAVLASESGYWKARILRWRRGMTTQAAGTAVELEAPTEGAVQRREVAAGAGEGGEGSRREVCMDAVTVATITSAAPSPQTPTKGVKQEQTAQYEQGDTEAGIPSSPTTTQIGLCVNATAAPAVASTATPPTAWPGTEQETTSAAAAAAAAAATPAARPGTEQSTTSAAAAAARPLPSTAQAGLQAGTAATAPSTPPTPPVPPSAAAGVRQQTDRSAVDPASSNTLLAGDMSSVLLEQVANPHELEAARYVLRYAYTHELPEDAAPALLMQMTMQADIWDMPQALEACLNTAAGTGELQVPDVDMLLDEDLPSTITTHAAYQAVVRNCIATLMKLFGTAQAVVAQLELLKQFCSLSLKSVQLWAQQDTLKVDHENTVAVLFTHWWDTNSSGFDEQQAAAACTVLTESIIVDQLSSTFVLDTLETLPWFKPTRHAGRTLRLLHGKLHKQDPSVQSLLPVAWCQDARTLDEEQGTMLEWVVTKADLDQLHNDAGNGQSSWYSESGLYWSGYMWHLALQLDNQKAPLHIGVSYTSAMPDGSPAEDVAPFLPAMFELTVVGQEVSLTTSCCFDEEYPMVPTEICGDGVILGVKAADSPRANSYPSDSLWKDGKLHLQVEMLKVW